MSIVALTTMIGDTNLANKGESMSGQDYEATPYAQRHSGAPMYLFKLPIKYLPVFKWARRWLNKDGWEMRLRGSSLNDAKAWEKRGWGYRDCRWANHTGSIPLDCADEFRVYFYRRKL